MLSQAAAILAPEQHAALARQLDDDLAAIRIQVHGMVKAYEQFLHQQRLHRLAC